MYFEIPFRYKYLCSFIKGLIIDDFDILIASIAIANNFILVTNNTDHFKRIEGLQIQDWLKLNK